MGSTQELGQSWEVRKKLGSVGKKLGSRQKGSRTLQHVSEDAVKLLPWFMGQSDVNSAILRIEVEEL